MFYTTFINVKENCFKFKKSTKITSLIRKVELMEMEKTPKN